MSAMTCIAPIGARVEVTRLKTSLALKLPNAFSSVLRVASTPAETDVLAETATSENSIKISCCCSRVMRLKRAISREMASISRG
jgi:hypothetical protein